MEIKINDVINLIQLILAKPMFGLVLICIMLVIMYFKYLPFQTLCITLLKRLFRIQRNLFAHDLFVGERLLLKTISEYVFKNELNTSLFRELLRLKVKVVTQQFKEFLLNKHSEFSGVDIYRFDAVELHDALVKLITFMMKTYENNFTMYCVYKHKDKGYQLSMFILNRFNRFHSYNVKILLDQLKQIYLDKVFLKDNKERIIHALRSVHAALRSGVFDGYNTFAALNGDAKRILEGTYSEVEDDFEELRLTLEILQKKYNIDIILNELNKTIIK